MRKFFLLLLALVTCMGLVASPAAAWEFSMDGAFTYAWQAYSQAGNNGFFGPWDASTDPNATTLNFWGGVQTAQGPPGYVQSGHTTALGSLWMLVNPQIRINKAVRIRGAYYIGGWTAAGAPFTNNSEHQFNSFSGVTNSFSPGYWNLLWLTAQTPWGIVATGKRPFAWGTGLYADGSDLSTETLLLVVPYGPFTILGAIRPFNAVAAAQTDFNWDSNVLVDPAVVGIVRYGCGPLEVGSFWSWVRANRGPEQRITLANRQVTPSLTATNITGMHYVKYNNGRFFLNAEVDNVTAANHFQQPLNTATAYVSAGPFSDPGGTTFTQADTNVWRALIELGTVVGPARVTGLWSWCSGDDVRAGHTVTTGTAGAANTTIFRQYSLVAVWNYGLGLAPGTGYRNATGNGYVQDANVYAGRVDYAAAANLNLFGSFFWAERIQKGPYGWGYISPNGAAVQYTPNTFSPRDAAAARVNAQRRSIPDNHLGWEIDAGADWQLLEGYRLTTTFGWWQPGKWFNYACVDRTAFGYVAGAAPTNANSFVNPNRTIDPVWGLEVLLNAEF